MSAPNHAAAIAQNRRAWDRLAQQGVPLAQPASAAELANPLATVDPLGWLGPSIANCRVLCLAAGGGRHSVLYAAANADVSVVDISPQMLALDLQVAREHNLSVRIVESSMDDLSAFADESFDLVIQPVSTCYLPEISALFGEVARVTRGGGLYISQHKSPTSLQLEISPDGSGYQLTEPYYRTGPLPQSDGNNRVRENGTLEFLHRWEELIGGICRAGFVVEDLVEPPHAKGDAMRGTFAHRSQFVAPYVRIKARRHAQPNSALWKPA